MRHLDLEGFDFRSQDFLSDTEAEDLEIWGTKVGGWGGTKMKKMSEHLVRCSSTARTHLGSKHNLSSVCRTRSVEVRTSSTPRELIHILASGAQRLRRGRERLTLLLYTFWFGGGSMFYALILRHVAKHQADQIRQGRNRKYPNPQL